MDIYVGNINYNLNEAQLRKIFEVFGDVFSVIIIKDKITDRSKGFGFVKMNDSIAASRAVDELNGRSICGRNIIVSFSSDNKDEINNSEKPFIGTGKDIAQDDREDYKIAANIYDKSILDDGSVKIKFHK